MEDVFIFLWVVLPIVIGIGVSVLIIVIGQVIKARISAISKRSFEKLANELKEENALLKADLVVVKEHLASINKMLKEVE